MTTRSKPVYALLLSLLLSLPWLGACAAESTDSSASGEVKQAQEEAAAGPEETPDDDEILGVVARVGDQRITFRDINTMINSAAIVGLSMPELGSPERDVVRITLLDKMISANLLYLDALEKGVDKDPEYQQAMQYFSDGVLATLYRSKILVGDIEVSDEDIQTFYKESIVPGTELSEEVRLGIEATIRKDRVNNRTATMRERLREGHQVDIIVTELDPGDDQVRDERDVVAQLDGEDITWGEVKGSMMRAHTMRSVPERIAALDKIIDARIMVRLAREAGLEEDFVYQTRYNEFSKTRLINIHRDRLLASWEPTEEEIRAYYEENKERVIVPEVRKVQMLVVETEQEAADLKKRIEDHELTFHKAVAEYSIVPDAKRTLGQIGWVEEGSGFPELDEETFLLEAGEIGGPVESPAGWHVVRVLDQRDAAHKNIADLQTQKAVRKMLLDDKLDEYVIKLRNESFTVEIDDNMFSKLSQQEIDWYAEMLEKAQKSPEEVIEEIKKLQR
jgi:hypothetical protein